jgi:hypothetical protein
MTSSGGSSADPLTAATRLTEAVEAADTLLYHAIGGGQELPNTVRDPIIKARAAIEHGKALTEDEEGKFLDAYAKLALRVAPVTAATLDATIRRRARRGWLGRLLGLRPVSDVQRLASHFGLLALCLVAGIAVGEWTHAFIESISAAEKQYKANSQEMMEANRRQDSIEKQIDMLKPGDGAGPDTASAGAVRQALDARKAELDVKLWTLERANEGLLDTIDTGYKTLEGMLFLGQQTLRHVSMPLGTILGGFLLPVLYGALGTCAFVMRSLFREMVDRTFDARRTGEFTVRIFLGMLSGLTLQWLVVRSDGTVAGGMTPAVLAFLGGYSVEMLFTAMDRLVQVVAGRMRTPHRSQTGTRPRRERAEVGGSGPKRSRLRELPANGGGPGQRAAIPTATLATVPAESG